MKYIFVYYVINIFFHAFDRNIKKKKNIRNLGQNILIVVLPNNIDNIFFVTYTKLSIKKLIAIDNKKIWFSFKYD